VGAAGAVIKTAIEAFFFSGGFLEAAFFGVFAAPFLAGTFLTAVLGGGASLAADDDARTCVPSRLCLAASSKARGASWAAAADLVVEFAAAVNSTCAAERGTLPEMELLEYITFRYI
jgi:hypothetical protein